MLTFWQPQFLRRKKMNKKQRQHQHQYMPSTMFISFIALAFLTIACFVLWLIGDINKPPIAIPTNTEIPATETFTPTSTLVPTSLPTLTSRPTSTKLPNTNTPVPTNTSTPIPQPTATFIPQPTATIYWPFGCLCVHYRPCLCPGRYK